MHIDYSTLDGLREILEDGFDLLLETYLSDGRERMKLLLEAYENNDIKTITDQAHGLKGSNRNLGINEFADLCGDIENQTREGNLADLEQKISALKQDFAAVCAEIEKLRT